MTSWVDHIQNETVRERCGSKCTMIKRVEKGVLEWFSHMERLKKST